MKGFINGYSLTFPSLSVLIRMVLHDLARQIERLDAQVDALVYELYGLTEEEIAIPGLLRKVLRDAELLGNCLLSPCTILGARPK